jgi:hypothetical protein
MAKAVIFKVVNNRMQFKCSLCKAKRNVTIPPDIRTKSIRCHKCTELTRCIFNRRFQPRENQSGTVILRTSAGREVDVMLNDLSREGLGFIIPVGSARTYRIGLGNEVRLRCAWNSRLIPNTAFVVKNIRGQRVGLKTKKFVG